MVVAWIHYSSSLAIANNLPYSSSPCAIHSPWKADLWSRMRSTGLPYSKTLPLSSTKTRSLLLALLNLGDSLVHDCSETMSYHQHCRTCKAFLDGLCDFGIHPDLSASTSTMTYSKSTEEVASSMTRIFDFFSKALAKHRSCFWPALKLAPSTATNVSRLANGFSLSAASSRSSGKRWTRFRAS